MNDESLRQNQSILYPQSLSAELANAITHGIATILSIVALLFLIDKGMDRDSWQAVTAYILYGASNIFLFLCSTLYHSFSYTSARKIFQKFDHAAIYILIAGTYTPYLVTVIGGKMGLIFLVVIWMMALSGIIFEVSHTARFPRLSTFLYLAMGWYGIFLVKPLWQLADKRSLLWLLIGGLLYSIGTIFYRKKSQPWMHVIWHLFVMAAAAAMFISVYFYT